MTNNVFVIALSIIITLAIIATVAFIISIIGNNIRNKPNASPAIVRMHDAVKKTTIEKFKENGHGCIVIDDPDCVPKNKITTISIFDMKTGKMYLMDRSTSVSGKDILGVCHKDAQIYTFPGDMFIVSDDDIDHEKLYNEVEE